MAHFDRTIPPGGEGKITLKIDTKDSQGEIHKSAKVYTNDPGKKLEIISMKATVKVAVYLSTKYVYLRGPAGQKLTKTIKIRAERDKPLTLDPGHFDLEGKVAYTIETVEAGKKFSIHFASIPGPVETYRGSLTLKTNYPETPEITIRIRGDFKKAVGPGNPGKK